MDIAGTIVPRDQVLVGRAEFRCQVEESAPELGSASQVRAAVNTLTAQPWILTLPSGERATLVQSADHWVRDMRHATAHALMVEGGKRGGRPRKSER